MPLNYEKQKQEITRLISQGQFSQAVHLLEKMIALTDPAAAEYVSWAYEELPHAQAAPEEWKQKAPTLLKSASQMYGQHDYRQTVELLQQIPAGIRSEEAQKLLQKAIDYHEEAELLLFDLKKCVEDREFVGIDDNLNRYLELKPASRFAHGLRSKLDSYAHLKSNERAYRFGPKGELLEYEEDGLSIDPKILAVLGVVIVVFLMGMSTYYIIWAPESFSLYNLVLSSDGSSDHEKSSHSDDHTDAATKIDFAKNTDSPFPDGPPGLVLELEGHTDYVSGVDFSPNGKYVVTCSGDKTIRIWDLATKKEIRKFEPGTFFDDAKFVNGGKEILASAATSVVFDADTGEKLREFPAEATVEVCALSPDETLVSAHSRKAEVRVWDFQTGELLHTFEGIKQGFGLGSGFVDNNRMLITGPDVESEYLCRLVDVSSHKTIASYPESKNKVGNWCSHTVVSPEQTHFLTCDWRGVQQTAIDGDGVPKIFQDKGISRFGYTHDGSFVYGGSKDGLLKFWDRASGVEVHKIESGNMSLIECDLAPNSQFLVTAGGAKWDNEIKGLKRDGDFTVRIWRLPKMPTGDDSVYQETDNIDESQATELQQISRRALRFDGDDWIEIPKLKFAGNIPATLEAIVEPQKLDAKQTVIGNFNFAGFGLEADKNRWDFIFHNSKDYSQISSDQKIVLKHPVHIAGVFDGRNISLYINGKRQEKQAPVPGGHRASPFPFFIGADPDGNGKPQKPFVGLIHSIRVSDRARYSSDFMPPFRLISDNATVALYDVDQGCDGKTLTDLSKNSFHGVIHGARVTQSSVTKPVRYIRIDLPGQKKYLSLAEVQVFSGVHNIATRGTATQSSTAYEGNAILAIDGNTDGRLYQMKSATHTALSDSPWWELDLGSEIAIDRIVVWNRTDKDQKGQSLHTRLNGFTVKGLDTDRNVVFMTTSPFAPEVKAEYQIVEMKK